MKHRLPMLIAMRPFGEGGTPPPWNVGVISRLNPDVFNILQLAANGRKGPTDLVTLTNTTLTGHHPLGASGPVPGQHATHIGKSLKGFGGA